MRMVSWCCFFAVAVALGPEAQAARIVRTVEEGRWAEPSEWVTLEEEQESRLPRSRDAVVINFGRSVTVDEPVSNGPNRVVVSNGLEAAGPTNRLTITRSGALSLNPADGRVFVGANGNGGELRVENGGRFSATDLILGHEDGEDPSLLVIVLGEYGFKHPIRLSGNLVIRKNQRLHIDAGAYRGVRGSVKLMTFAHREGFFSRDNVSITGRLGAKVRFSEDSLFMDLGLQ